MSSPLLTAAACGDSQFVLCVLLTAWFDEFVNSKAAICVALRVPTERVFAVSNVPFRRRQRRSGTSSFCIF